jgi:hypothetical protein
MDPMIEIPQLDGWVPVRLYVREARPFIDWCYVGRRRFTDPFFHQTIDSSINSPFSLLFRHQTPIEVMGEWLAMRPALEPAGFVFHMSRCGSTLVSQMLAALPDHIVISEAGPIDSIIRSQSSFPEVTEAERVEWLRWIIGALSQPRAGAETRSFVKFDSWNILHFSLVRQAFPNVPWIFIYRDPTDVLVSHLNRRGVQTIPAVFAPEFFGLDQETFERSSVEEYCAQVLAALCRAGLQSFRAGGGMLVNYNQLPDAMCSSVVDFFRLSCSSDELECMRKAARFDAKNPRVLFADNTEKKNRRTTDAVRRAASELLQPVYDELERERVSALAARAS